MTNPNPSPDQAVEQAKILHQYGDLAAAEALYRAILATTPNHAESIHFLGVLAIQREDYPTAVNLITQADQLRPNNGGYLSNLASALMGLGRYADAREVLHRATAARPDLAPAFANLGEACKRLHKFDEARSAFERAITLNPNLPAPYSGLGGVLFETGSPQEAIALLKKSLALDPSLVAIDSAQLVMHHTLPNISAEQLLTEARAWNTRRAAAIPQTQEFPNHRSPDRRLRIGFVSADLREHAVARFLLPLFANLDRTALEIFCYSNSKTSDAMTHQLRTLATAWRDITSLSDDTAADLIRADAIDLLIDLSMHTADNRLTLFARRPAPVQLSYLAYSGTTGAGAIHYRLSDPWIDPPQSDQTVYSEKNLRLPSTYWCYEPSPHAPPVNPLPALTNPSITFGSLNNFFKVNDTVLHLWQKILDQVPNSKLILHSPEGTHRQRVLQILGDRVEFSGRIPITDYFKLYERIDIALDTFPYAGGTTTCDALWMGVPVVTLAGKTAVGRGGVSILSNLNLPNLIASTPDQYVDIAQNLAENKDQLSELRTTLRDRMNQSALMDHRAFSRGFEGALRGIWRVWTGS